jgi:phosphoglycolate phosphatase
MRLVLFDIDGTLLLTGGAGMRAFAAALKQIFGLSVDYRAIRPDGKTDPLIAREMLKHFGQENRWSRQSEDELFSAYLSNLKDEMNKARESGLINVLPGVTGLLELLAEQPDFFLGLVTGNLEEGARIKLEMAGLSQYFRFGGYGSDSEDRTTLIKDSIRRGTKLIAPAPMEGAFVLGDTPLDIIHGHQAGACAIAVASAGFSLADLEPYKPDLLVPSLTPADLIISFIRSWPSPPHIVE